MSEETVDCNVLIIGSGPGGSITACLLAEAGQDVLLVEEGPHLPLNSSKNYSLEEMDQKYRNVGITPTLGKTKISYVEGCCVGGGSEINSGLYHRLPNEIIKEWQSKYQIKEFNKKELEPFYEACEKDLSVSELPNKASLASLKLKDGADKLNWKVMEVPRWFRYSKNSDGTWFGNRQSMTESYIPRAVKSGCRLISNTKIKKIILKKSTGMYAKAESLKSKGPAINLKIRFQTVFVCGGAIQTPTLLRRSGIKRNIGNSLCMHPMLKVAALFDEEVNSDIMGVPVHQVNQFAPTMTLGCSISTPAYIASCLNQLKGAKSLVNSWRKMAVYYVATSGTGQGTIRVLPFSDAPLVRYQVTVQDLQLLKEGLERLSYLLFKSGALEIYPAIQQFPPLKSFKEIDNIGRIAPKRANLTTVHLFSSCPMGEDIDQCAVNSYGKLHGYTNIYLNDGSILSSSPSVNPQGTIMALARRNALKFLESKC